jgi:choice-of-anchor C domain-containing protein
MVPKKWILCPFHPAFWFAMPTIRALVCAFAIFLVISNTAVFSQVTSTWNGTTGNWTDTTRWSTDPLFPNNGNGGNDYNAVVNGGTVTLDQDIEIEGLTLGAATINGNFNLVLNNVSTWTTFNSVMSGSGTTTIASGATLNLILGAFGERDLNRTLVNHGTTNWLGGIFRMNNATIQNNGTFIANSGGVSPAQSGTNVFENAGTFIKQGTGYSQFYRANGSASYTFNNSGLVDVQQGILYLQTDGNHSGDFIGTTGAVLSFSATNTFQVGADITGGMNLEFFGTNNVHSNVNITGELLGRGNNVFHGTVTTGSLSIEEGVSTFNGSLTASGGLIANTGTLTGSANWDVTNTLTWTSGTMAGTGVTTIAPEATLSLAFQQNGSGRVLSRSLVNEGTTTWTFGELRMQGGTIQNNGTFIANSGGLSPAQSGTNVFENAGTFIKQGTGYSQFYRANGSASYTFNNSGLVDVQQGILYLQTDGNHSGDFIGAAGATLEFASNHSFAATSDVSGGMNVLLQGTSEFTGSINWSTTGTTTLNGTVTGSGNWNVEGPLIWAGGTMSGSGTTTISNGSISGAATKTLNDRTLRSAGNIDWSQGNITTTGSSVNLIANGGFETPVIGPTWQTFHAGSTELAPWDILSGSVDIVRTFWPSNEGQNSLDLGGESSGTIQQSFATVPGREYTLSFQYGNHPSGAAASGRVNVIGTATLLNTVLNHSGSSYPNMQWTPYMSTFIADSTTTTLRFIDLTNSSIGFTLDTVLVKSAGTSSTIHVPNGSIFTISGSDNKTFNANLQIDAGGTLQHVSTGTTSHVGGTFINNGLVQVNVGTLAFNSGGSGSGTFFVAPGASLQFNGPGHNYNGGVTLNDGTLQLGTFSLTNGTVQGTGTIDATTFTNASEVAPGLASGDAIGELTVDGNYVQVTQGNLTFDIEDSLNFDTLDVTGTADLGGTLAVTVDESSLQAGDSFEIITAGDLLETTFDNLVTTGTSDFFLALDYQDDLVSLITFNTGNMNGMGGEEADEDDIPAFALALTNPSKYFDDFGANSDSAGDIDGDGDCDVDDIDNFKALLPSMSMAEFQYRMAQAMSVPEPGSLVLVAMLAMMAMIRRNNRLQ